MEERELREVLKGLSVIKDIDSMTYIDAGFICEEFKVLLNDRENELLTLRYIGEGETWESIADKMLYSLRGVYMLEQRALKKLNRALTANYREMQLIDRWVDRA